MSSDSDHKYHVVKRRRLVIQDDESSDESVILRSHRRKKVHRVLSDGDSSDEENNVPRSMIRRKKHRVISEDDTSDESIASGGSRSNPCVESDTSEFQSDSTSTDEVDDDNKNCNRRHKINSKSKIKKDKAGTTSTALSEVQSDNSDEQVEKCPICLLPFRKQELATPSSCEHCFCLVCLIEWSKNINTCPVDRQTFNVIHVRKEIGGKILRHIPVEITPREEQVQEDPTFCEVCHQCDREDRMLLCDSCDSGYHLECLTPPMNEVPMEEWFCPECSQNSQNDAEAVEIDLDEISDLMEEARRLGVSYWRSRSGVPNDHVHTFPRIIPRTRQTERVRANIRNRARELQINRVNPHEQIFDPNQPSTSSGLESVCDNSRSRSPIPSKSNSRSKSKAKTTKRKKKKQKTKASNNNGALVREVRITEYNDDGEEEEIVTYVKVAPTTSRRKSKKRTKKTRKVYC